MNDHVECVSLNKIDPEFCGQLWLFKIFMKMGCYQNKMSNTLSGSFVVVVESEYVQMLSICLAAPLARVTSAVPGWTCSTLGWCAPMLFYFK